MPKKNKNRRFDKKKGVTFHVVQRSFQDPLGDNPNSSKFVLQPDIETEAEYERMLSVVGENQDCISHDFRRDYYDSYDTNHSREYNHYDPKLMPHEYDYSKHMKPIDEKRFMAAKDEDIPATTKNFMKLVTKGSTVDKDLEEILAKGTIVEEPIGGAELASEDFFDSLFKPADFEEIQDDFISAAMVEDDEKMTKEELNKLLARDDDDEEDDEPCPELVPADAANEVTRTWLDDHFDYMIEGWGDENIGALDDDDVELHGCVDLDNPAMERFLQNVTRKIKYEETPEQETKNAIITTKEYMARSRNPESEDRFDVTSLASKATNVTTFQEYTAPGAKWSQKWDCESILSTRTNYENHPTILGKCDFENHPTKIRPKADKMIKLTRSGGIPVDALRAMREKRDQACSEATSEGQSDDESHSQCSQSDNATASESQFSEMDYNQGRARPKNETKDEKRARKRFIKEQRRRNRERKKKVKGLFRIEEEKQTSLAMGMQQAHTATFRINT